MDTDTNVLFDLYEAKKNYMFMVLLWCFFVILDPVHFYMEDWVYR